MHRRWIIVLLALTACPKTSPAQAPAAPKTAMLPDDTVADAAPTTAELEAIDAAVADAPGDVEDPELRQLLSDHWAWTLERNPLEATSLGLHAYDARVAARGPKASEKWREEVDAFAARAKAIEAEQLVETDAVTLALFIEELEAAQASAACRFEQWSLSARSNPVTEWNYLPDVHPFGNPTDASRYLARVRAIAPSIGAQIDSLEVGVADGLFANAESTRRVLEMLDRQIDAPLDQWPLASPIREMDPGVRSKGFDDELLGELEHGVRPALVAYRDFVRAEILPNARSDDAPGLASLPVGAACYASRVRKYTTLPRTAEEVHAVGKREIERINAEMRKLGKKLFGTKRLPEILARLRDDESLFFEDAAAVRDAASEALADAKAKMPDFFGRLPKADCVVTPIPDYEAPYTTIAYYRQPHADGSKPGEYFINLYEPQTRPKYEARVLAVHESIPGHHLQIAIAQELEGLPAFRKHGGMTVFVEGWGLYTERLAEEMGLYHDDLDRMGMLSFDAWRASRLVVDTGLHAMGWSREQAETFMLEHTALAPNNIDNEVDRYITTPGQALAYKTGQLELWRLREKAERELGSQFDIRGFHDAVLGGGAVTLEVLERRVESWISAEESKPPSR